MYVLLNGCRMYLQELWLPVLSGRGKQRSMDIRIDHKVLHPIHRMSKTR